MTNTKIINGKEYTFLTRRENLVVARRLVEQLKARGKDVQLDKINTRANDIYIAK